MSLTVKELFSSDRLTQVWRAVRVSCHNQLVRDPLDHLPFEANLKSNLQQLAFLVVNDRYRPVPPTTIRAAKARGLTRPLSFLEITDTLVLKAIVDAIQGNLHEDLSSSVSFGRSQEKAFHTEPEDYETWFQAWMRHQRLVQHLLGARGCEWVARADVSNFFPSISHQLLYQCVMQRAGIEERMSNLLFLILESMAPRPEYSSNRHVGLPQEDYDASRILAHAFLGPVDKEFQAEIDEGRYARWVDDIVIGVHSEAEGWRALHRLEKAMEHRGLFVNSAKSKILRVEEFADSLYPEWNEFLDRADVSGKRRARPPQVNLAQFNAKLAQFLGIETADRRETWDRVLRRFYTVSRHMGSDVLENHVHDHLMRYPSSAAKITSYLLGRPYSTSTARQLLSTLQDNIYEDVEILIYELLLKWAIPDDDAICLMLADACLDHFFARSGFRNHGPLTEHARGLIALVAYKFGAPAQIGQLAKYFVNSQVLDPAFARYALCALCGTDTHCDEALSVAVKLEDRTTRRLHAFLTSLRADPSPYAKILKKRVTEIRVSQPRYVFFPARMLPLVRLVRANRQFRGEWDRHLESVVTQLEKSPRPFRDERSIRLLRRQLESP